MLLSWHNLHHYQALMADLRAATERARLADFAADFAQTLMMSDPRMADQAAGAASVSLDPGS
jgi:queuine/archaeosine tRNA-ribosyltransferase